MSNDASEMRADAGAVEPGVIDIIIDEQGIPHIFADTDEDLFYGYGYQIATDRLFQLDMFRRRALGRTSEVLGVEGIIPDQQAAIFNWAHWGRLDGQWMAIHEPIRYRLIESYVEGVNARISEVLSGRCRAPHEYGAEGYDFHPEYWSADDVFVIQKIAGFSQDLTLEFSLTDPADRFFGHLLEGIELFKPVRTAFGMPDSDRRLQLGQTHLDPIQMTTPGTIPFSPHITPSTGLRGLTKIRGLGSNNWARRRVAIPIPVPPTSQAIRTWALVTPRSSMRFISTARIRAASTTWLGLPSWALRALRWVITSTYLGRRPLVLRTSWTSGR